jgi:NADPH:quinone reductase-like Zn-dependent oxidoreductase
VKAVVNDTYGSPAEVMELRDIDVPTVPDDGVLIRVYAAAVNPPDWAGVTGVPYIVRPAFGMRRPKNPVRGTDVAGVVEAVGRDVKRFRVGDAVFGSGVGTFAQYAIAEEKRLAPKPANITFEQAAAVPMAGLTAYQALRDVSDVQRGQKVLIVGAGGGIGTFAVQIAKWLGAEVTGVCSTSKLDLVQSLGADHVIDYTKRDFTEGDERYDCILDNVLDHSLSQLVRVLTRTGTLVPNGGQFYKRWTASTGVMLIKAPLLSAFVPQRIKPVMLSGEQDNLLALKDLLETESITPVIGNTYELSQAAEAIACWGAGHARGKIVVRV